MGALLMLAGVLLGLMVAFPAVVSTRYERRMRSEAESQLQRERELRLSEAKRASRERERLLEVIVEPRLAMKHLLPEAEEAEIPSDDEIDEQFAARPEAVVPWDQDLAPIPGVDVPATVPSYMRSDEEE